MTHKSSYLGNYANNFIRNYNLISSMLLMGKWDRLDFLNLGYSGYTIPFDISNDKLLLLNKDESILKNSISLYAKTLDGAPSQIQSALEIGSGLGGGCYLLKKYYGITDVTGIDYTLLNILYSKKKFRDLNIHFHRMAAEESYKLQRKFDLILSLEASQLFYSWEQFMKNVHALLEERGRFHYADLFTPADKVIIENIIESSGLTIIHKEDITPGVIESVQSISGKHEETSQYKFLKKIFLIGNLDKFNAYQREAEMHKKIINNEFIYMKYIIGKNNTHVTS